MGQYFTPIFLNTAGTIVHALDPADYGSGLKLTGHTRVDTALMRAVLTVLSLDGGSRMVWAGDYADPEPGAEANLYFLTEPRHFLRLQGLVADTVKPNITVAAPPNRAEFRYVCNPDKRQYIDNDNLPVDDTGWRRTPLPRLLADGGPGHQLDPHADWRRDRLHCAQHRPDHDWTPI